MNVSLDQAIEMHASALSQRNGRRAPRAARDVALRCAAVGDRDGQAVWLKVAEVCETFLHVEASVDRPAGFH